MKTRPLRGTLVIGLVCAFSYLPVVFSAGTLTGSVSAVKLFMCCCLVVYACYLAGGLKRVLFPLTLSIALLFPDFSIQAFCVLYLFIFSWIRSGICFPGAVLQKTAGELILNSAAAGMIWYIGPSAPLGQALGVWLFFLIQSLYFLFYTAPLSIQSAGCPVGNTEDRADAFDRARRGIEEIISA